uniref:polynucleotide adenylyltransferase n=1 Tax=Arcella intermedia TaxID=1963864 RepID=A0A6B2L0U0_9EUKA
MQLNGVEVSSNVVEGDLIKFMVKNDIWCDWKEQQRIDLTLCHLELLIFEWLSAMTKRKGIQLDQPIKRYLRIFAFGATKLGVRLAESEDVDILLVFPSIIHSIDIPTSFHAYLSRHRLISNLILIEDARVPVLKFTFHSTSIDLVWAITTDKTIPEDFDLMKGKVMDFFGWCCNNTPQIKFNNLNNIEQFVHSMNGPRVAEVLLKLVGEVGALENYRTALRCIKKWAKCRMIYSNALGFFGGVTWAILMAKICLINPTAGAGRLVQHFFQFYSAWNWKTPVCLREIQSEGTLDFLIWNPFINENHNMMPVITPTYPPQNSTYNVTRSNKEIIIRELIRGNKITTELSDMGCCWEDLFRNLVFWDNFHIFISVTCFADNPTESKKWLKYIESRIRILIGDLSQISGYICAHPYPLPFVFMDPKKPFGVYFIGLDVDFPLFYEKENDIHQTLCNFENLSTNWKSKTHLMGLELKTLSWYELPGYVFSSRPNMHSGQINIHCPVYNIPEEARRDAQPSPLRNLNNQQLPSKNRICPSGKNGNKPKGHNPPQYRPYKNQQKKKNQQQKVVQNAN